MTVIDLQRPVNTELGSKYNVTLTLNSGSVHLFSFTSTPTCTGQHLHQLNQATNHLETTLTAVHM